MKEVKSISGKKMFYPVQLFCYRSIKESLITLLLRPGFEIECEKWRSQNHSEDVLADVHDGEIWKNFTHDGTSLFFSKPHNYGVMLNVDWFQPFKHLSSFSIGGIYLVLLNLPYHLRFKRKNLFLLGIIPDMPKEPPTNSFLEPLVEELERALQGFMLKSLVIGKEECYRLDLLCVGCDIPAAQKMCGFLGMNLLYSSQLLWLEMTLSKKTSYRIEKHS